MAAKGDSFTSIGPDWYNVYKKTDGTILVKPCPGVVVYSRDRLEGYLTYVDTYAGFVQFKEDGGWGLADSYEPYIGTFHIPDFHEISDEVFRDRYVDNVSALGWMR